MNLAAITLGSQVLWLAVPLAVSLGAKAPWIFPLICLWVAASYFAVRFIHALARHNDRMS